MSDHAIHRWMERRQVPGVAFSLNESVQILSGIHAGSLGAVVSLIKLEPVVFSQVEERMNEPDWLSCRVVGRKFECAGGAGMLSRAVRVFVEWAESELGEPSI